MTEEPERKEPENKEPENNEPENQEPENPEPESKATEGFVDQHKFDRVFKEMKTAKEQKEKLEETARKQREQLDNYQKLVPDGEDFAAAFTKLQTDVAQMHEKEEQRTKVEQLKGSFIKLGGIESDIVVQGVFNQAKEAGVLGSSELTNQFLEGLKEKEPGLFKREEPASAITTPLPSQKPRVQEPPASMTSELTVEQYQKMELQDRVKLDPRVIKRMEEAVSRNLFN